MGTGGVLVRYLVASIVWKIFVRIRLLVENKQQKKMSKTLEKVIADLRQREEKGIQTYGGTVDQANLSKEEWLQHAYEEALDLCIYLKKLMS